jgi:hypothetical protein
MIDLPLVKIDEERRLIIARAAAEEPDRAKEIMDYATAVPQFQAWSQEFERSTNGLSKGNVRVMHDPKSAVGKVTEMNFNDSDKAVEVVMKIIDDQAWRKALEGVYTGVSIGGGYLKKWKDGDLTRYTPIIREISLVDNPCIPTARFAELVKANGATESLQLNGQIRTFSQMWAEKPQTFAKRWHSRPRTFNEIHFSS